MSTAATRIPPMRSISLVGWTVIINLIRRREPYVLFILMGCFLVGVGVVSIIGIEKPSTATFLLNLGMTLAYYAAHILTLILSVRQIPDEIENRTLYPLLAKPLNRPMVFLGKWLACCMAGIVVLLALMVMGWFPVPKMEAYSTALLMQVLVVHTVSLSLLAALGMCFSLFMPRAVNFVVVLLLFAFGQKVISFARARAFNSEFEGAVRWVTAYIPDFSKLNMITRYTDGIVALGPSEFAGLLLYGLLMTAVALVVGMILFERQTL